MRKQSCSLVWNGMAASVPGNGHLRRELPCQDASSYFDFGHPTLIALDGRGSSPVSQEGSAEGVSFFKSVMAVAEPWLACVLDRVSPSAAALRHLERLVHRTLVQAKINCVWRSNGGAKANAFDFTAAVVVVGKHHVACFQAGDCAIVFGRGHRTEIVFPPEKGEVANETRFVRGEGDGFRMRVLPVDDITGIAVMTDGIEHRVLDMAAQVPGPLFDAFYDDLRARRFSREDLLDFLTANDLWAHGDDLRDNDDRTLGLMVPTRNDEEKKNEERNFFARRPCPGGAG